MCHPILLREWYHRTPDLKIFALELGCSFKNVLSSHILYVCIVHKNEHYRIYYYEESSCRFDNQRGQAGECQLCSVGYGL